MIYTVFDSKITYQLYWITISSWWRTRPLLWRRGWIICHTTKDKKSRIHNICSTKIGLRQDNERQQPWLNTNKRLRGIPLSNHSSRRSYHLYTVYLLSPWSIEAHPCSAPHNFSLCPSGPTYLSRTTDSYIKEKADGVPETLFIAHHGLQAITLTCVLPKWH